MVAAAPKNAVEVRPMRPEKHIPTTMAPRRLMAELHPEHSGALRRTFDETLALVTPALGKPYFAEDGFILYRGECLDGLRKLGQTSLRVPLSVTSPPYNIGKEYEKPLPLPEFIDWCGSWMGAIHAITASDGSFWLNLGYREVPSKGKAVPLPYLLWDKSPFFFLQEIVWNYGAGVISKQYFCPRNEKWLFYVRDSEQYTFNLDDVRDPNVKYPNQKKNGKLRCHPLGKNPSDVWEFPKVTSGANRSSKERTAHPAQFPLAVVERVIRASSNQGDLVLDPFSGSASTGIAAIGCGRAYLGFEVREDYCELSVERFKHFRVEREKATAQTSLEIH